MSQNVLTVARPEEQATESANPVLIHVVDSELEENLLSFLVNLLLNLAGHFLDNLLDSRRMNASVSHKAFQCLLCDFLAHRVETAYYDSLRRIVDDDIDTGERLKSPDISSFPTDDSTLHLIARKRNCSDSNISRSLRSDSLNRGDENLLSFFLGRKLRILLNFVQENLSIVPSLRLKALNYKILCFLCRKPGYSLKLLPVSLFLLLKNLFLCLESGNLKLVILLFFVKLSCPFFDQLLFFVYTRLIFLKFSPSVTVFPFLLVSFTNELIFCFQQNFFFLCFCFLYSVLPNAFSFLF